MRVTYSFPDGIHSLIHKTLGCLIGVADNDSLERRRNGHGVCGEERDDECEECEAHYGGVDEAEYLYLLYRRVAVWFMGFKEWLPGRYT